MYANVKDQKAQVPKIKLTESIKKLTEYRIKEDKDKQSKDEKYTKEEKDNFDENKAKKIITKTAEYMKNVVGAKPITRKHVLKKLNYLVRNGVINEKDETGENFNIAAKTVFREFLENNLKMDKEEVRSIKVKQLFFSTNPDVEILYIECYDSEDIAKIYSYAKNLPKGTDRDCPQLVSYVPTIFHNRHRDVQTLAYNLRIKYENKIVTNLRMGKNDYILRMKEKGDPRNWSELGQVMLPDSIRPFETGITKTLQPVEFKLIEEINNQSEDCIMSEVQQFLRDSDKELRNLHHSNKRAKLDKMTTLGKELESIQKLIPEIHPSLNEPSIDQILNHENTDMSSNLVLTNKTSSQIKRQHSKENIEEQNKIIEGPTQ